jgi:cytochrome bd ubiquinol oxidase subunit II
VSTDTWIDIVAGIFGIALTAYILSGGADYGGGIWDLVARGPRRERQRALISHAIGPIWEANHVWLILIVVLLFTCFPPAFAAITTTLHIPITLLLLGIVLRGSAFTFRAYDSSQSAVQERWGLIFAIASVVAPFLLGVIVGAIASDSVGVATALLARGDASFAAVFIWPWLNPFTIAVGAMALVMVSFLAATYLTVESANDPPLQNDFRVRALGAAGTLLVVAYAALLSAGRLAPRVYDMLMKSPIALPIQLAAFAAGLLAVIALWTRRFKLARTAAAALSVAVLWGWLIAQYPYVLPPTMTLQDAAASPATLRAFTIAIAAGFVLLVPSLWYLLGIFHRAHLRDQ